MLLQFLFTLLVGYAGAFQRTPVAECDCEVRLRTEAGWACGRVRIAEGAYKYASFRAVPYAAPPLGERRFSDLEPVEPWDYLLDATEDGPACPQKEIIYGRMTQQKRGQSEDCIHLNLHVPYDDFPIDQTTMDGKGLPILVMIHGGGFQSGSGLTDIHGPEYLMTKRVIVISFNYRLNVFGFLSLGTRKVPGNQGLRDIIKALRWVQRHARAFGGDPDNVTLIGQSVGATCAHLLSLSRAAEGLFHRVIMMSGHAIPNFFATNPQFAQDIAQSFLEYLGINSTNPDYIHYRLVNMPLVDIMYANSLVQYEYGLTSFVPVEEKVHYPDIDTVLEASPLALMAAGRGIQYPLISGYTDSEAEAFKWVTYAWQMVQRIQKQPSLTLPLRISYAYPNEIERLGNRTAERCFHGDYTLDNFVNCYTYLFFKYPMLKIAQWRSLGGAPSYAYRYTYESERSIIKEAMWTSYRGAAHIEDLTYVFRTNSLLNDYISFPPKNNDDRMKYWWVTIVTNFMRCNNPTCTKDEKMWPPLKNGKLQYQEIAKPLVYEMKEPDPIELDWLQYYDEVDPEVRSVGRYLEKNLLRAQEYK